ncbi:hypothetical protein IX57_02725 [Paracoccus sanguinis]|nr:hypothetical protein IX57_02725 [Paracoccus sanguinis]
MRFDDELCLAWLTILVRLNCTDKRISQYGLCFGMKMYFRLLHPHGGTHWTIEGLHQRWKDLRNTEAYISELDFGRLCLRLHQNLILFAAFSDGLHAKLGDDAEVNQPRCNELVETLLAAPAAAIEPAALSRSRKERRNSTFTLLAHIGGTIA